jgi:amidase
VPDELATLDALAQAELVRRGDATPTELVDAALARIDAVNPEINAVIHRLDDKARAVAARPEHADGPFHGVPFLVKDVVCHTAGDPYHCGMRFLKDRGWTARSDTYLARKFREAGFVFVGKSNTPELATSVTTEPLAYGPTRNPWDLERSTGGSSGGAAAAVAAGLVPVAHANDMGGSIRAPASECGLVGLKPSRARTSLGPDFGEFWGPLTHEGVVTRSVRDTAAVLDAIAGPMPGDPYHAPPPARPFLAEVAADPGRLRIGVRTAATPGAPPTDPDCVAAAEVVAARLAGLGHDVSEGGPAALDEDPAMHPFATLFCISIARELDRWASVTGTPITESDVEPWNWTTAEAGRGFSGRQYLEALEALHAWSRRLAGWWTDHDLLVTPTLGATPPRLGVLGPGADPAAALPVMGALIQYLLPWNMTGQPAISLPLGESHAGLPIGVQLVAAYGREDVLLRVASQLEAALPWAGRAPRVHG